MAMKPQSGKEGQTISLSCTCNDTSVVPRWFKGNKEVLPSEKYSFQIVDGKFVLTIKDAEKDDQGDYTVKVDEVEASAKLTIQAKSPSKKPRKPISILKPEEANEADTIKIICLSDDTSTKPRWYLEDVEIFPSDKYSFHIEDGKYVLTIRDASLDDAGLYKIKVVEEEASATLTIKG